MPRTALAFAAAASITAAASADILLTVDITNPAAVVISTTGGASSVTTAEQGRQVALLGALAAPAPSSIGNLLTGNLTASNGRTYNSAFQLSGQSNVLISGSNQFQAFTQGQQAFFGSSTVNLSFPQFIGFAPVGTVGDIVIWDSFTPVIGQYQIIPAPGAAAALGLAALAATRRRRA